VNARFCFLLQHTYNPPSYTYQRYPYGFIGLPMQNGKILKIKI
jgi:hypothetical protein